MGDTAFTAAQAVGEAGEGSGRDLGGAFGSARHGRRSSFISAAISGKAPCKAEFRAFYTFRKLFRHGPSLQERRVLLFTSSRQVPKKRST